jgi:hypothetical protein
MPTDFILASRVTGILVFLSAVIGKVRHWQEFRGLLADYRVMPRGLVGMAADVLIAVELVVAVLLIFQRTAPQGGALGVAALLAFSVGISVNLLRGRTQIDCGCFQASRRQTLSVSLLLRNGALMLLLLVCVLFHPASPNSPAQWLDGIAGGAALFLLYLAVNELRAIAAASRKGFA